jgi:hypothetical protein
MRLLLVLLLVHGLVPALGEVAEAAVHYGLEGHLAHSAADRGDLGEQGHEHGCGTTEHHCDCCASQAVMLSQPGGVVPSTAAADRPAPLHQGLASLHEPAPPHRPPIPS